METTHFLTDDCLPLCWAGQDNQTSSAVQVTSDPNAINCRECLRVLAEIGRLSMNDDQPTTTNDKHHHPDGRPYTDNEEVAHAVLKGATTWALNNKAFIGVTTVLVVKNRKLKKQNAKLKKDLVKAGKALNMAADYIENMTFFGPRRGA